MKTILYRGDPDQSNWGHLSGTAQKKEEGQGKKTSRPNKPGRGTNDSIEKIY